MKLATIISIILFPFNLIAQEIEGHWHIYSIDEDQNLLDSNNYHTLDIYNDQTAFYDKEKLNSPDNLLFNLFHKNTALTKNTEYTIKNVEVKEKIIFTHGLSELFDSPIVNYKVVDNQKLMLSQANYKNVFMALRSNNCEQEDYCLLNANHNSYNWCELEIDLPEISMDKVNYREKKYVNYDFSIYIGYKNVGQGYKLLSINFNKEKEIFYNQIDWKVQEYRDKIPELSIPKLTANLYIDKDVPIFYCKYLKSHLQKNGQLRVRYMGKENSLLRKLPPLTSNECKIRQIPNNKCKLDFLYDPSIFKFTQSLRADWNPIIYFIEDDINQNKERKIYIKLEEKNTIVTWNEKQISYRKLAEIAKKLLLEKENSPEKIIFLIETAPNAKYSEYVRIYATINNLYETIWNIKAKEKFGQLYNSLSLEHKREIVTSFPKIIRDVLMN